MDIFNNDSEVLTIGNLTVENHTDKVVIHGDIEIGLDDVGRQHAQALFEFANNLLNTLKNTPNQEKISDEKSAQDVIENPFV